MVRNHNGTPFLPDQLLERYLIALPLKGFPCEDTAAVCDTMRRLVCDYLESRDDEHSSLQEKFIHALFKKYGFTAQSLPVLVHGVQSMQNMKPAKEFRPLIVNEESLSAPLESKEHPEYDLPEESSSDKKVPAYRGAPEQEDSPEFAP